MRTSWKKGIAVLFAGVLATSALTAFADDATANNQATPAAATATTTATDTSATTATTSDAQAPVKHKAKKHHRHAKCKGKKAKSSSMKKSAATDASTDPTAANPAN